MTTKRKKTVPLPLVAVILVLVAGLIYGYGPGDWFGADQVEAVGGAPVRRGPLTISVIQRGNLEAKNSVKLRCDVEGRTTILFLEPEGSFVQEGQVVAELDASNLVDRLVTQDIAVQNADAAFIKAKQDRTIQVSQNDSDIKRAEQNLEFARMDRGKYLDGDWPQQQKKAEEDIILAEEELAQAAETFEWSQKLYDKGFYTRTQLDRDDLSMRRNGINVDRAKRAKELLEQFDNKKRLLELDGAVEEAVRELERVKLQAAARLVDHDASVRTSEARLSLETENLAKLKRQVEAAVMRAPVSGMVVYGRTEGGRMGGGEPIQEGTEVRERQEIITIPREGGMIVEASLHESVLKSVQLGQPCLIRVDALPSQVFHGTVEFVALLPDRASWWANPNQRLFKTHITIDDGTSEMRPGTNCSVEIVIDELLDTLFVPVQSIFVRDGKTVVFIQNGADPEVREVEVGPASEKWVSLKSGVQEGEIVLLSAPAGFHAESPVVNGKDDADPPPPVMPGGAPDAMRNRAGQGQQVPAGTGAGGGGMAPAEAGAGGRQMPEGMRPGGGRPGGSGMRPGGGDRSMPEGRRPGGGERGAESGG
ncbi:MAG: HlyD family efflux transporter periplasmic adaptor subunit [Planctomycetes bacterium]|nr:HlyD family efflux transporter periplasmic adaptor subunit [Planctomycetota bacterium]